MISIKKDKKIYRVSVIEQLAREAAWKASFSDVTVAASSEGIVLLKESASLIHKLI
jgi:hypothetical protein